MSWCSLVWNNSGNSITPMMIRMAAVAYPAFWGIWNLNTTIVINWVQDEWPSGKLCTNVRFVTLWPV